MPLRERLSSLRRGLAARRPRRRADATPGAGDERGAAGAGAPTRVAVELAKLAREMLVIPLALWLAAAEIAGTAVLAAWRRLALPLIAAAAALVRAAYRLALRHLTPARGVAAVCAAALAALAASQWLDLSGVSVGTDAYAGGLEAVAPAPEVDRERAGDAHAWVMLPLALAGAALLALALAGRPRAAWGLAAVGGAALAISLAIDMPAGLDEGTAAIAYQGAEAHLLEGFWVQVAAAAALIAGGLLLPSYLRGRRAAERRATPERGRRLLAGARDGLRRRSGGDNVAAGGPRAMSGRRREAGA